MAGGQPRGTGAEPVERSIRRLARLGCGPDELKLLEGHLVRTGASPEERREYLASLAAFARSLGPSAARDYFRAIATTGKVDVLTAPRLLDFASAVGAHTAEWFFWAIWGTGAVGDLTDDRVLSAVRFFRSIDSPATVEYFLALRETKETAALTSPRVLDFVRTVGSDAAVEFFGACWETRAVGELTASRLLEALAGLGSETTRQFYRAVRATREVDRLGSDGVLDLARLLGPSATESWFRSIAETKDAVTLTDPNVMLYAELIGRETARAYFRVVASSGAVGPLTTPGLLATSGVIRSIGKDAAVDYFLAVAAGEVVPSAARPSEEEVPLVTLLDLPSYRPQTAAGLAAISAAFWGATWRTAPASVGHSPFGWVVVGAIWVAVVAASYVLIRAIAGRAAEQFVARRRRLLNEHGIRWHDCLAGDRQCELCWTPAQTHQDQRFDYGRFCRCTAC